MTKLIVPGDPVPQGRPRVYHTRYGVRGVDPAKSRSYKQLVQHYARQQWHRDPLSAALRVSLTVYRPIQRSGARAQKIAKKNGTIRPTVKPDVDNYYKAVSDALTGIVWCDDNQIVEIAVAKFYDDGDGPRVEIEVEEL
ncbi:RusA family crossover junction endodeoxyribonuclease [Lacticaseibacillus daqingensis]|uniref:RusA family crossover junction endodeoxyribonuclease n=1 Tax=Lacticaseibacillus daqingensis TaxID=2486014 RepID=UPI000F77F81C|nr:RusA family crossover junction endodeoxyribonuclease [Lacticaseibacillus daqingensis]